MKTKNQLDQYTALVTGASRGVGRGIAIGLGEYGSTVYITGRNLEALNETTEAVRTAGGTCIPIQCDHRYDDQTKAVLERIKSDGCILSILVNCAWGGYEDMVEDGKFTWTNKFWDQSIKRWDKIFEVGVRSIFVTSKYALELMRSDESGLIVNISFWAAKKYVGNVIYGASKAAADKLTSDMALELRDTKISVVSLYPGLVRTEEVMKAAAYLDLTNSESPQFIGRVIANMFLDPAIPEKSGKICIAAQLAMDYHITDIDGKQPHPLTLETV